MNILFVTRDYPPNLIGGVGVYVEELSRPLTKMGHKVFVLTQADEFDCEYVDRGVRIFGVRSAKINFLNPAREKIKGFLDRLEYSWAASKKIKEIVQRYKIDIIESCEARAEGLWFYMFRNSPPLVIKLHTPESIVFQLDQVPKALDYLLIRMLEECWIRKANKIVGLSKSIIELSGRFFQLRSNNFPIVPNPIDIHKFKPGENSIEITDEPLILYVGRLEFRKGVHVLIRAIPLILKNFPKAKFQLIGDDCGMRKYLLKKVDELGLNGRVTFIEQMPRSSLIEHYHRSTLCVIPSLWENHPFVLLEAMACGKAVVATYTGGIPEIIQNNIDGILVSPGSPLALADGITELLNNKELRESIGKNARTKIEKRHSPYEVARRTLEIYGRVTKNS